jgi:hypothetical protein
VGTAGVALAGVIAAPLGIENESIEEAGADVEDAVASGRAVWRAVAGARGTILVADSAQVLDKVCGSRIEERS